MPQPPSSEILTRQALFQPSSYNAETHSVDTVFSTGAPVVRRDFQGNYTETLDMSPEACDLGEFVNGPVLNSHDRFDVRSVLGVVESATVDGQRGLARLRFGQRASDQGIEADVANGILRSVSVGYTVQRYDTTKDSSGARTKVARKWKPLEVSLVSIPSDSGARIRSMEGVHMDEDLVARIRASGALLGIGTDVVDGLVTREGITLETARSELLTHLQRSAPRIDARTSVEITRDENDGFVDRALNAIAHRVAPGKVKLEDAARPWIGRRLADIGREMLRMSGASTLGGDNEIFLRWGALHTTSDFGNFLAQLFNKQLLPVFLLAPSGLKEVTRRSTANDFRNKNVYRNSPMGKLMPLNEHGEFQRTSRADVKPESYRVESFAAVFGISRQSLVNDDMGVFTDIAQQLAIQSMEFENSQLANLLVANPLMSDGYALFSAAHGNLAATAIAVGEPGLTAARLAMRLQTNQNGQPINIRPMFLLTSAAQETAAKKALSAIYPTQTNFVNVFTDFVQLVIDPRLDLLGQTTAWYLFADTGYAPVLEDSYLSGYEGPRVFVRVGFQGGSNLDGVETLCQLDYGVGAIGWLGAYKNPGA
jgi:hypothetical protein